MGVPADLGAGPKARKWADPHAIRNRSPFDMRESQDFDIVADLHIGTEDHMGLDGDVLADLGIGAKEYRSGIDQRRAIVHGTLPVARLQQAFDVGELGARIDAMHFCFRALGERHLAAFGDGEADEIGQVIFVLGIVIADLRQEFPKELRRDGDEARIAQIDAPFIDRRVELFTDGDELAGAVLDEPSIAGGIDGPEA